MWLARGQGRIHIQGCPVSGPGVSITSNSVQLNSLLGSASAGRCREQLELGIKSMHPASYLPGSAPALLTFLFQLAVTYNLSKLHLADNNGISGIIIDLHRLL